MVHRGACRQGKRARTATQIRGEGKWNGLGGAEVADALMRKDENGDENTKRQSDFSPIVHLPFLCCLLQRNAALFVKKNFGISLTISARPILTCTCVHADL